MVKCRWEPQSYGYHGDDGKKYHANGHGDDYGPTFSTGDVVGAGVHLDRQEIFFTCAAHPPLLLLASAHCG